MTNVPQNLRDMWKDIYCLFDANYLMPNTEDAWQKFWDQAMRVKMKYEDQRKLMDLLIIVGDMIGERQKAEKPPVEGNPCTLEDMKLF